MKWISRLFRSRKPTVRFVQKTFAKSKDEDTVLQVRVIEVRPDGCDPDLRIDLWAQVASLNETFQFSEVSADDAGIFAELLAEAAAYLRNSRKSASFTISRPCSTRVLSVKTDRYRHGGGLVVEVIDEEDGMPYATVSVNLGISSLADDEFVFKTYSENEGLLEAMLAAGIVERTERTVEVGMAGAQPICRLKR